MIDDRSHETPPRAAEHLELGQLTLASSREGAAHVIRVHGELDLATADRVETELLKAEASDAESIVLDLAGLTFMDSTGVRLILAADARSRADRGRLALRRGPANVQRVLEISGIVEMLPFED